MGFLTEKCINTILTEEILSKTVSFTCGNQDLDDFFRNDSILYAKQRLGKTYCYLLEDNPTTLALKRIVFSIKSSIIR